MTDPIETHNHKTGYEERHRRGSLDGLEDAIGLFTEADDEDHELGEYECEGVDVPEGMTEEQS
jgi:hypothetical protein